MNNSSLFRRLKRSFAAIVLIGYSGSAMSQQAAHDGDSIVIRAGSLHVGDGQVISPGVVVVIDGRITAVGADVAAPAGARFIDLPEASVTPGLIDANAWIEPGELPPQADEQPRRGVLGFMFHPHQPGVGAVTCMFCDGSYACAMASTHDDLGPGELCPICGQAADGPPPAASGIDWDQSRTEGSSEVVPHTAVFDSLNLQAPDFDRLLRGGVTTVYAAPDSAAVIGPRGAVVRTAGNPMSRVLRSAAAVAATLGVDSYRVGGFNQTPSRFQGVSTRTRRPNSRMGVAWVFRKAFYDAEALASGQIPAGADLAPPEALEVVQQVRQGEVPLRVQARTQRDILTALRMADEFDLSFTLVDGAEADRCLAELKESGTPVVFGPVVDTPQGMRARLGETREARWSALKQLLDAGIPTALSAQDLRDEDGLARQAMFAIRAGVTPEAALTAVTLAPARLLGLEEDLGSIEVGKRGDLVIWSGSPFDATSKPIMVVIDGVVEFQTGDTE